MPSCAVVYLTLVQMPARGDKGVALLEDAAFGSIAQTIVSARNRQPLDLLGFKRCKNVLRYVRAWRQVYATAHACVTPTPNSVQSFTPDNLQSDKWRTIQVAIGRADGLSWQFLPFVLLTIFGTIGYYLDYAQKIR